MVFKAEKQSVWGMVSKVEKQERGVVSKAGKNRKWLGRSLREGWLGKEHRAGGVREESWLERAES